jgi:hypothetical protein
MFTLYLPKLGKVESVPGFCLDKDMGQTAQFLFGFGSELK